MPHISDEAEQARIRAMFVGAHDDRADLLGVVEPPQEPMPFPEWQANAYREFAERHADILFVDPGAPPGKPCKPIPCPIGEDEF